MEYRVDRKEGMKALTCQVHSSKRGWLARFIKREYNQLEVIGTILLALLVVAGIVIVSHAADAVLICLQFGADAYFRQGVRHVPHEGFFRLTNGKEIAPEYGLLFFPLFAIGILVWTALALIITIGMNKLFVSLCRRQS